MQCERNKEHETVLEKIQRESLQEKDVVKICKIFQLLSDCKRFKIVEALLCGELCVFHLTEICQSTMSAVSHQLRLLKDNGLVKAKRVGKFVEYSIADEHIEKIVKTSMEHLKCMEK